jgi:hypothetical protein
MKLSKCICVAVALSILASAPAVFAALDVDESFNGTDGNPVSITDWSTSGSVIYSNNQAYLSSSSALTNTVSDTPSEKAWTDFWIQPALGASPSAPPTNTTSALLYFDAAGYITVWNSDSNAWITCSNNIWGGPVTVLTGTDTNRISIYQNFTEKEYAVFLDSVALIQDVPFPKNTLTDYTSFQVDNVDSNAIVDEVWIQVGNDSDHSGDLGPVTSYGTDVEEIDTVGYVARTLYVGGDGTENEFPAYSNITAALAVYRDGDQISIDAGYTQTDEAVAISSGTDRTAVTFVGEALQLASLTVNTGVTVSFAQVLTVDGTLDADDVVTLAANTTVGTLDASADVTLTGGADLTVSTLLNLTGSATLAATGNDSNIDATDIDMVSGTTITVASSGTLSQTTAGIEFEGGFTINGSTWEDDGTIVAQALPYSETFENYVNNEPISDYGMYGWGASSADVEVTTSIPASEGTKSLILPDGTVASNKINSGTAKQIWTTYYLRPALGVEPSSVSTTGKSLVSYVDTNGYMVVRKGTRWVTCDETLGTARHAPAQLSDTGWRRVAIYTDYNVDKASVFVDNNEGTPKLELVAELVEFPGGDLSSYESFMIENQDNNAYIDNIVISTEAPGDSANLDGDAWDDVYEIATFGGIGNADGLMFRFF